MTRRIYVILILSLLLLAVAASSVLAGEPLYAPKKEAQYNPADRRIKDIVEDWKEYYIPSAVRPDHGEELSLGMFSPAVGDTSPGQPLGNTYYDYQANSYQGRMIRAGRHYDVSTPTDSFPLIHFIWMNSPTATLTSGVRNPAYAYYDGSAGTYKLETPVTFGEERSGYFNLEITKGNQAIIGGHYAPGGNPDDFNASAFYGIAPGSTGFNPAWVPDEAQTLGNGLGETIIWPHIAFQQRSTGEHITHLAAVTPSGKLYYFRKEGNTSNMALGELSSCSSPVVVSGWNCPYPVDTISNIASGIEASKQSGKVALFYVPYTPNAGDPCDTCSRNDPTSLIATDMYYQVSTNYGFSWGNTKNITHTDYLTTQWEPSNDIDGLWDSNDEFHIAWEAFNRGRARDEGSGGTGTRVYHWMESFGNDKPNSGNARVAMQSLNAPIRCNGGSGGGNLAKINIAECNGNIYVSAVDYWDGHFGMEATPDCAKRAVTGAAVDGAANGEIVVAISDDMGSTFDLPHNLTRSTSRGCEPPPGVGGKCQSDTYPSMIPRGFPTRAGEEWGSVTSVNPRDDDAIPYPDDPGAEWLHFQYVHDWDAGSAIHNFGKVINVPVKHFRMACVPPAPEPVLIYSVDEIGWPVFVNPTMSTDIPFVIENIGNSPTTLSVAADETTGVAGWLSVAEFGTNVGEGTNNKDTGNVHLNAAAYSVAAVNAAGGSLSTYGLLTIAHQGASGVDTIPVRMIVTDTVLLPKWDTMSNGVLSLRVGTNGYFGGFGLRGIGMDYFFDPAECDSVDTIRGNTKNYLYSGAYAVGRIRPSITSPGDFDTIMTAALFTGGPREPGSVYQTSPQSANPINSGIIQTWNTGKMVSGDTALAFSVRYTTPLTTATYGTLPAATWYADQRFYTRELKIWSNNGLAQNGLAIGDIVDWDVPSDSGANGVENTGDTSSVRRLVFQRGAEFNQDSPTNGTECQDNNTRYAGSAFGFLRAYWNHDANNATAKQWTIPNNTPGQTTIDSVGIKGYGGYTDANAHLKNIPLLYATMAANEGYTKYKHTHPDSIYMDLHAVLTGAFNYNLAVGDTVAFYTVYASVRRDDAGPTQIQQLAERGRNFVSYFGCCVGIKGDLDGNGTDANILDLNYAVSKIFRNGLRPACQGEGDVNSDKTILNILDLNFLVNKIFRLGPLPASCGVAL